MLGDSQMLTLMFYGSAEFAATGPRYRSAAIVGCGVFDPGMQDAGACGARARTWRNEIHAFDPDLSVLLVGAWESLDFVVGKHLYVHGTADHTRELVRLVERAIGTLTARGGRVALLEVPPFGNPDDDTLYAAERDERASVDSVNDALRAVAAATPAVTFVPWVDAIAPHHQFAARIDGIAVRPDGVHFATEDGARLAVERLAPTLRGLALRAHADRSNGLGAAPIQVDHGPVHP